MKKQYTVKASKDTKKNKIMSAQSMYMLNEFPVETWEILEDIGFTTVYGDENDTELYAISNYDDLIVSDGNLYIMYYSNIPSGRKEQFLHDMLEEDCFPNAPINFQDVDIKEMNSLGEMIDSVY